MDSPSCVAHTSLLPSSSCSGPFMVFHAGTFRDPMGPPQDQADTLWVSREPTGLVHSLWRAGFLVSEMMTPVRGRGISILAPLLGSGWEWPCLLSQVPALSPCSCLGGSGWGWAPRLLGGLLALPSPGATPLAPPAKFPRGCLIRRALAAHSWVWFFAVWMLTGGCGRGRGDRTE